MIVGGTLFLGVAAVGAAVDNDELLVLGVTGSILDGMFAHVGSYSPPKAWGIGLGKGLLSVALRGSLATGACFIGAGCQEVSDAALLRMSVALVAGDAIDIAFLAYETPAPDVRLSHHVAPLVSRDALGARWVGSF